MPSLAQQYHSTGDYIMNSRKWLIFFKIMLLSAAVCSLILLSACKRKNITDAADPAISGTGSAAPAVTSGTLDPTGTDSISDTTAPDNTDGSAEGSDVTGLGDENYEGNDSYEGFVGTVEPVPDSGDYYPLLIFDGISYCVYDDHAEVLFTWLSDDTLEEYVIRPELTYEGKQYPVTVITDQSFYGFESITSVSIPSTVTTIGDSAFEFCDLLTTVNVPDSVTYIGDFAFSECTSLTEIVLPDSVEHIGTGLFFNCEALSSVVLPAGLTAIPDETFSGCAELTMVELPAGIVSIGREAFWYCEMISSLTLPSKLVSIGDSAFYDCISLTEITLPASLSVLSDTAFDSCDSLATVYCPAALVKSFQSVFDGYDFEVIAK